MIDAQDDHSNDGLVPENENAAGSSIANHQNNDTNVEVHPRYDLVSDGQGIENTVESPTENHQSNSKQSFEDENNIFAATTDEIEQSKCE